MVFRIGRRFLAACSVVAVLLNAGTCAGGGIDHVVTYDNSGIWNRSVQNWVRYSLMGGDLALALWEGGESPLGKTSWQAIDSGLIGGVSSEALKHIFTRARPDQGGDPNKWFQGSGHYSFPSGEVTTATAIVTPFVLEYARDNPWVYGLEILPAYTAIARVKVQAHWQTDVIAGFALGTLTGYYAHWRETPLLLSILPNGFMVGIHKSF